MNKKDITRELRQNNWVESLWLGLSYVRSLLGSAYEGIVNGASLEALNHHAAAVRARSTMLRTKHMSEFTPDEQHQAVRLNGKL